MKKILIRRLGVESVARFVGIANAIWGFALGFVGMFGGISAVLTNSSLGVFQKIFGSIGVAMFALIIIPILAFLLGWLYGAVVSIVANLFLQSANGIELDIDEEK